MNAVIKTATTTTAGHHQNEHQPGPYSAEYTSAKSRDQKCTGQIMEQILKKEKRNYFDSVSLSLLFLI